MIVFYHHPCLDGFTSAWVFWSKYKETIDYRPFSFKAIKAMEQYHNKDVMFVDCCPGVEELKALLLVCSSVKVIDHHVSNMKRVQQEIEFLTNEQCDLEYKYDPALVGAKEMDDACHFDMTKSGAGLAWEHCYPDEPVPKLVRHIQDHDLWNFDLPFTEELTTVLYTYSMTFEQWDSAVKELEDPAEVDNWLIRARAMMDYQAKLQEQIVSCAHRLTVDGHDVPAVCTTVLHNDAGSILNKGEAFAATYYFNGDGWKVSLRSDKDSPDSADVSVIANKYGGGGHKNAAGFRIKRLSDLTLRHKSND
jgi:oligoribonuclease NrnB/cAMP/cGMP phosphodiesterase (DHH superfamily)